MKRRTAYNVSLIRSDYFIVRGIQAFVTDAVERHVGPQNVVIDVGCGEAPWRPAIEERGARYVPCDIGPGAARVVCTSEAMPFRPGCADVILCTEVLEHLPDLDVSLREIGRVVAPGGIVIVTTPFFVRLHEEPWDFRRPTPHRLRAAFEAAGFSVLELLKLGNEAEVVATVVDGALLALRPEATWARVPWGAARGLVRLGLNAGAMAVGRSIRALPKTAYLGHGLVARRRL